MRDDNTLWNNSELLVLISTELSPNAFRRRTRCAYERKSNVNTPDQTDTEMYYLCGGDGHYKHINGERKSPTIKEEKEIFCSWIATHKRVRRSFAGKPETVNDR